MPKTIAVVLTLVLICCNASARAADLYKPETGHFGIESAVIELPNEAGHPALPLRVTWPDAEESFPLIIFSHGMGGSRNNYQPLVHHWVSHGYVVIQPTHGDSIALAEQRGVKLSVKEMLECWQQRPRDIIRVLDQLGRIEDLLPQLVGMIDDEVVGVGGHSFGAHTTQLVAGMETIGRDGSPVSHADARPVAFLMISPPGVTRHVDTQSFSLMTRPVMVVTGTNDESPFNKGGVTWRLQSFTFLPAHQDKYLLFIQDAYHDFGGIAGAKPYLTAGPPNSQQVDIVNASSTAFWDAYLGGDRRARSWLDDDVVRAATSGRAAITTRKQETPTP